MIAHSVSIKSQRSSWTVTYIWLATNEGVHYPKNGDSNENKMENEIETGGIQTLPLGS